MKILVTGGAGFIGSHFVRSMLAGRYAGYEDCGVTVLDRLTYAGNTANLPMDDPRLTFVRGDICDATLLAELMPGHSAIVHFAAESHVDRSIEGAEEFVRTNVLGTHRLLDAALRAEVGTFLHISTDEVYGSITEGSWTEDRPLQPHSPYAASKAASELIARSYRHTYGMDVRITRCCNNYGPYQYVEKLVPLFITNLLSGRPVPLYGDGSNIREWLHVDDHCRAVHLVLRDGTPGETYNVGGGHELTNSDMTDLLLDLCGADRRLVRHVTDRKGHDFRYSVDGSKIRAELGYVPLIGFERGLADTVTWYRDNPGWWKSQLGDGHDAAG